MTEEKKIEELLEELYEKESVLEKAKEDVDSLVHTIADMTNFDIKYYRDVIRLEPDETPYDDEYEYVERLKKAIRERQELQGLNIT